MQFPRPFKRLAMFFLLIKVRTRFACSASPRDITFGVLSLRVASGELSVELAE